MAKYLVTDESSCLVRFSAGACADCKTSGVLDANGASGFPNTCLVS